MKSPDNMQPFVSGFFSFQSSPSSNRNYDSVSFQCWVLFHFMNRLDFVYKLIRWSTQQPGCFYLKLLWLWVLISMCLSKCLYALLSPWYVTYQWNYVVLIYLAFWKYSFSSDWLHHFKKLAWNVGEFQFLHILPSMYHLSTLSREMYLVVLAFTSSCLMILNIL